MPAPQYLSPIYIDYDMISRQLERGQVKVVNDPLETSGIYIGEVETLMANAESYIIQTVLSNYVAIPLQTITGGSFEDLLNTPAWINTYTQIRSTFIAQALSYIYQNYFAIGGEGSNGEQLIKQQQYIISNFTAMAMRLDQSGNLQYQNIFEGLKPCVNARQRIAKKARIPSGMPTGASRSEQAINSIPDYKYCK